MRRTSAVLALLLTALPGSAYAQSWSVFEGAFPLFPCQDGWTGCRVDGRSVTPELQPDGTGALNPANLRLGWFDLQPTAAFSPFVPLSVYTGEEPARVEKVAVADTAPRMPSAEELAAKQQAKEAAEAARQRQEERRRAEEAAARARQEQEAQEKTRAEAAQRKQQLEQQAKQAGDAQERQRLEREAAAEAERARQAELARQRAEAERQKQEAERQRKEKEAAEAARKAEEERLKAEQQAREAAEREAAEKAAAEKAAAEKAAAEKAAAEKSGGQDGVADASAAAAAVEAAPATCEVGELVKLEPMAMLGKLSRGQIDACEASLAKAPKMTDKDKISRVLMGNAFSKGDKGTWERLVKRHLDEIDQSDPDLCYKYALHLSKMGPSRATGVIRWANVALENRTVWVGDTYTNRVYSLYKLRASAAQTLWKKAETDFAANPSEAGKKKVDDYRNQTKVLSREWFEYAKAANRDHTQALQLCMSAAGTSDYCEAR